MTVKNIYQPTICFDQNWSVSLDLLLHVDYSCEAKRFFSDHVSWLFINKGRMNSPVLLIRLSWFWFINRCLVLCDVDIQSINFACTSVCSDLTSTQWLCRICKLILYTKTQLRIHCVREKWVSSNQTNYDVLRLIFQGRYRYLSKNLPILVAINIIFW